MSENTKQDLPFFSFLAIITIGYVHVFCPLGRMVPVNKLFILGGGTLFNPPRGKHVLKRAKSHRCEVIITHSARLGASLKTRHLRSRQLYY